MNINEDIQENISKAKELALKQRMLDKGKRLIKVAPNLWKLVSEEKYKQLKKQQNNGTNEL